VLIDEAVVKGVKQPVLVYRTGAGKGRDKAKKDGNVTEKVAQ
jgi:hypothetical protein